MERKDGKKNEETIRIRMSKELMDRIKAAKVPYGWGEEADSSFARHLLILGVEEAEKMYDLKWRRERAIESLKTTAGEIEFLSYKVRKYAEKHGISEGQAAEELGVNAMVNEIFVAMEAYDKEHPPSTR